MTKTGLATHRTQTSDMSTLDQATQIEIMQTVAASKAANTLRAYKSDLRQVAQYLADSGRHEYVRNKPGTNVHELRTLLPAPVVAAYLVARAKQGTAVVSLARHIASLSKWHQVVGENMHNFNNPCHSALVRDTLAGLRKQNQRQAKRATPLTPKQVADIVQGTGTDTLRGVRDIALVLMGWCGALRRSELANLKWSHVQFTPDGLLVTIMQAKTDTKNTGQQIGVPYQTQPALCPVRALTAWRDICTLDNVLDSKNLNTFVFTRIGKHGDNLRMGLSGQAVGNVVSNSAQRVGLRGFTGHSLRSGLATAAILAGTPEHDVMNTTRHRSQAVFRGYVRHAEIFTKAASRGLLS